MTAVLYIQAFNQQQWDAPNSVIANVLKFQTTETLTPYTIEYVFEYGAQDPSATPYPLFPDDDAAFSYYESYAGVALISQANAAFGVEYYSTYNPEKVAAPVLTDLANYATMVWVSALLSSYSNTGTMNAAIAAAISAIIIPSAYTDTQAKAAAIAAPLTGLGAGSNAAIAATDTILGALAKLQAQIVANFTRTTSNITPSLVGTGATGTQVSATKNSSVRVWLNESVTSSIGGAAVAAINVKICPTNNATEASWTTLGTFEEDQTVTLAIALQSVQVMKGMIEFDLPAGYYYKLESSGSGTNSEAIVSGQQTIYG